LEPCVHTGLPLRGLAGAPDRGLLGSGVDAKGVAFHGLVTVLAGHDMHGAAVVFSCPCL
jgi:hypothetical protein